MARYIPISQIKISPKRQRTYRSQEDHQDLFISISESEAGLIHAPQLWQDGEDFWLVAGEGRLKVVSEMAELGIPLHYEGEIVPEDCVPYTLIGNVSALGRFEAEFDENVRRTPLSVAERASSTAQLFELKKMKAERDGSPPPTVADLSMELKGSSVGDYQESTRKELIVARYLDDPEVAGAKSINEAFNVVRRKETQRKSVALSQLMGGQVKRKGVEIFHADAIDWLRACEPARFDIVLTDPPYGMGADGFGVYNESDEHAYDDSYEAWLELMAAAIPELARVCKPDAHLYLFCDFDRFHELKKFLETHGWIVHRTPIIWKNPTGFRTPWPVHGPQRKYEMILYARRGEKKTLQVFPDLVEYTREKDSVHRAQKPVALLRDLLRRSAMPTDTVLDFCAGGGSTGVACHQAGLECVLVEKEEAAYGAALKRIQALK